MLQYKTLEPSTLELLKKLQAIPDLAETRLVGGTALALQLGHRKSIDLDFFGSIAIPSFELRGILTQSHDVSVIQESKNINIYDVDNVKVDFVNYKYRWIDEIVTDNGIRIAGIKDIAAMKIAAIIGRGTKKDFVDLYFLLKHFSLKDILDLYMQKYPDGSLFIAMKSVAYFEDAESDPMPYMFDSTPWSDMKATIRRALRELNTAEWISR